MKKKRAARAFTLIEILVVVAIIALLISILLPSLRMAREQGKRAYCLANLSQLGKATAAYLNDYKNRYCWGWVNKQEQPGREPDLTPMMRTWSFGGNAGTWEGADLPPLSWHHKGHYYPVGFDTFPGERLLNKYVTPTKLRRHVEGETVVDRPKQDLKVYQCPNDTGIGMNYDPEGDTTARPAYEVVGTSYQANLNWSDYATADRSDCAGWGEGLDKKRVLYLMDRIAFIFEKKGASRAVMLYEDPADCALGGAKETSLPGGAPVRSRMPKFRSWHLEPCQFSMLFLDGHATNSFVEYWKNLDHTDSSPYCRADLPQYAGKCLNGSSAFFTHQDYKDE